MLLLMRRLRNTEMMPTETKKEVKEVTEVAVAEEAAIKVVEVVQDPKLNTLIVMIAHMENANHFTKRRQLITKTMRKLKILKRKSKVVIREVKIEIMKLMKTPIITNITMPQDQNTKEFKSQ